MNRQEADSVIERFTHGEPVDPPTVYQAAREFELKPQEIAGAARLIQISKATNGHHPRHQERERPPRIMSVDRALRSRSLHRVSPEFWVVALHHHHHR